MPGGRLRARAARCARSMGRPVRVAWLFKVRWPGSSARPRMRPAMRACSALSGVLVKASSPSVSGARVSGSRDGSSDTWVNSPPSPPRPKLVTVVASAFKPLPRRRRRSVGVMVAGAERRSGRAQIYFAQKFFQNFGAVVRRKASLKRPCFARHRDPQACWWLVPLTPNALFPYLRSNSQPPITRINSKNGQENGNP